jgi:hypothetical protein
MKSWVKSVKSYVNMDLIYLGFREWENKPQDLLKGSENLD